MFSQNSRLFFARRWSTVLWAAVVTALITGAPCAGGTRKKVSVPSTLDGVIQTCYVIEPENFDPKAEAVPLVVALHTWSGNVEQRDLQREAAVEKRGWLYLAPDFRGVNNRPEACGSPLAQQDVLDALAWTMKHYPVDSRRVYLTGVSGGGHMTMLLAGRHPDVWAAASAWVGISDLAAWHQLHAAGPYGAMLRACCGGAPGESLAVDKQYQDRSPLTHLARARELPLDLAAGVHDGHRGSVPVWHTLAAFNAIARATGKTPISDAEMAQIGRSNGRLDSPREGDELFDPVFGRDVYLRRTVGPCRVTIFEGGHEGLAEAAVDWLARHTKPE